MALFLWLKEVSHAVAFAQPALNCAKKTDNGDALSCNFFILGYEWHCATGKNHGHQGQAICLSLDAELTRRDRCPNQSKALSFSGSLHWRQLVLSKKNRRPSRSLLKSPKPNTKYSIEFLKTGLTLRLARFFNARFRQATFFTGGTSC